MRLFDILLLCPAITGLGRRGTRKLLLDDLTVTMYRTAYAEEDALNKANARYVAAI